MDIIAHRNVIDSALKMSHKKNDIFLLQRASRKLSKRIMSIRIICKEVSIDRPDIEKERNNDNCGTCIEDLSFFFESSDSTALNFQSQDIKNRIINDFKDCFESFTKCPDFSDNVIHLVHKINTNVQTKYYRDHPDSLGIIIKKLIDTTQVTNIIRDKIFEVVTEVLKEVIDSDQFWNEYLDDLEKNGDSDKIKSLLNRFLKWQSIQTANSVAIRLPQNSDGEVYLEDLEKFIDLVRDEIMIRNIFSSLSSKYITNGRKPLIDQFLGDGKLQRSKSDLKNLTEYLHQIANSNDPIRVKCRPLKRNNKAINSEYVKKVKMLNPVICDSWGSQNDTIKTYVKRDKKQSTQNAILISGSYEVNGHTLAMNLDLSDSTDRLVLGSYNVKLNLKDSTEKFKTSLTEKVKSIRNQFLNDIKKYKEFEKLMNENIDKFLDINKFKTYLLYGISMKVKSKPSKDGWLLANGIHIAEPFVENLSDSGYNFSEFKNILSDKLKINQRNIGLTYKDSGKPNPLSISISGELISNKQLNLKMVRSGTTALTLEFQFTYGYNSDNKEEIEYIAELAIGALKNYSRSHFRQISERDKDDIRGMLVEKKDKIHFANGLTSLFFAGTAQYALAPKMHLEKPWESYLPASIFAIAELSLLVGAVRQDSNAINNLNDKSLEKRNTRLLMAGGVAVISTVCALLKIRRHNKSIKSNRK
ncbi:hypothetical protein QQ020_21555 [Fulvivirgaceae bacterium BMA12]|uniref:Uncharacterized protein n=1 Tax=Agaribacillus aureus TaxID=3051825 RepID=A0ABT8LA94_9BACT|nr:hypothetical protein [Fulvivirgaceae bacterium BMA12]